VTAAEQGTAGVEMAQDATEAIPAGFDAEASRGRAEALEAIAAEIRSCTNCRLHVGRTKAVPGEGHRDTEVVFVGEGPGFNEDQHGRPFVGRAGDLLVRLLREVGWRRDEVFITNVVKCRPPENRDPEPDEIAACAPFLQRQLAVLDPALVVTLGRHSLGRFMPGARIGQVHGTFREAPVGSGARDALAYAMYHPAAALRTPDIERQSFADVRGVPMALSQARSHRERDRGGAGRSEANEGSEANEDSAPTPTASSAFPAPGSVPGQLDETIDIPLASEPGEAVTSPGEPVADPRDQLPLF